MDRDRFARLFLDHFFGPTVRVCSTAWREYGTTPEFNFNKQFTSRKPRAGLPGNASVPVSQCGGAERNLAMTNSSQRSKGN